MHILLQLVVLILTVLSSSELAVAQVNPTELKVTKDRHDDRIEVLSENAQVTLNVRSSFGIGRAVIERTGSWPDRFVVRLHLKGLEKLGITAGDTSVHASVGFRDAKIQQRVWLNDAETNPLNDAHPCWVSVRVLNVEGQPASDLPLKDGFFEIVVPQKLLVDNPQSISIEWIDFYRN